MTEGVGSAWLFGGSGFIGRHLARGLIRRGYDVTIVDLVPPANIEVGERFLFSDVRREITHPAAAPSLVVNLAAVHRTPGHQDSEYFETNIAGAQNVTRWASGVGASKLVFTSSISVYGAMDAVKDENSEPSPNTAYGKSKWLAEAIHRDWASAGLDRQLSVCRPAVIFGSGENGNFTRLAKALRRRRFAYPGTPDVVKSCGYVSDLVDALLFASDRELELFNFCFPTPYTIENICQAFHDVAGYRLPRTVPPSLLRFAVNALTSLPASLRPSELHPDRVRKLTISTNIRPRALQTAGYSWSTDLASALADWRATSNGLDFA